MPILGVWLFFQPKIDGFIGFEVLLDFSSDRQMTPKNFALFGTRHFTHLSGGFFGSRRVGSLWIWGCCEVGKPDVEGDIINAHETRVTKP